MQPPVYPQLAAALRRRLEVIGDHALRERDPQAHLRELQAASERIAELQAQLPAAGLDPQLAHFLQRCSYDKALAWLEEQLASRA
jgi:hypothetical protein